MSDDVTLSLKSEGLSEVVKSLHSMRDAVINAEKESFNAVQQGAQKRLKAVQSEYKERLALLKQISKTENELNASVGKNSNGSRNSLVGSNTSNIFSNFGGSGKGLSDLFGGSSGLVGLAAKAGVAGAAFSLVKSGVDMAVEGLKMFGSFLVNDIVKPGFKLQTLAQQIENNSNGAIKAADVESQSRAIATKYNMDPSQVAESGSSFGESTGDYKLGFQVTEFLAGISKSTGAKMEDLSGLANALYSNGMSFQDVKNQLLTQIGQGQVAGGKYTIKQVAGLQGAINEPASMIAGGRDVSVASTTAMVQLAGATAKSIDGAMTSVKSFVTEVAKDKSGNYKSVINSQGLISDPRKAIELALIKTGGGQASKMEAAGFKSTESAAFLGSFSGAFQKAMEGLPPTAENFAKAAQIATENFNALSGAVASEASVRDGASKVLNTSGEKLESMFSKLKNALAEKVMPAADKFVGDFVAMTPQLIQASLVLANAMIYVAGVISSLFGKYDPNEGKTWTDSKGNKFSYNEKTESYDIPVPKDETPVVNKTPGGTENGAGFNVSGTNVPASVLDYLNPTGSSPSVNPVPVADKTPMGPPEASNGQQNVASNKAAMDDSANGHKAVAKEAQGAAAAIAEFRDQLGTIDFSGLRSFPLRH